MPINFVVWLLNLVNIRTVLTFLELVQKKGKKIISRYLPSKYMHLQINSTKKNRQITQKSCFSYIIALKSICLLSPGTTGPLPIEGMEDGWATVCKTQMVWSSFEKAGNRTSFWRMKVCNRHTYFFKNEMFWFDFF